MVVRLACLTRLQKKLPVVKGAGSCVSKITHNLWVSLFYFVFPLFQSFLVIRFWSVPRSLSLSLSLYYNVLFLSVIFCLRCFLNCLAVPFLFLPLLPTLVSFYFLVYLISRFYFSLLCLFYPPLVYLL